MKLIKDIGSIGAADIISSGIGSVLWLYLASLLTAESYGEIQFFVSLAGMAFAFSMIGARNTIVVYEAKNINLRRTLFLFSILGGIGASVILFLMYQRFDIVVLTIGMIFGELTIGYFLGKKLFIKYAIFIIFQKILMISLAIGLYFLIGIEGIVFGIGFSYIPLVLIVYKGFKESKFDVSLLKKHSWFIINNYGLIIVGNAKNNLDKILIGPLIGFSILGNYSIAFQVYLALMIFANAVFKYTLPYDSKGEITKKFKIFVIIVSIILALIGIIIIPKIIPIFFPNFVDSIKAIPILSLAVIPNTISLLYSSKFLGAEKSQYVLIGIIATTAIYLIFVIILGQKEQLVGISLSYLLSSSIYATYLIVIEKMKNL